MDIKIGKLRINLSAIALYEHGDNPELSNYIAAREAPKTLYNWNCQTQQGDRPRGPVFAQETIVKFLVTNERGRADDIQSGLLRDDAVKAADVDSINAFDRLLQAQLKPLEVRIDWQQLWGQFKDTQSLRIMYQVKFLHCVGRPYGMDIGDYIYFLFPIQVSFKTVIVDPACGGALAAGATATGMSARRMGAQQSERIDQLERQINEEEREAEEARQRAFQEMMLEWGPPFTHEGGLLEDDEEPEEEGSENNEDPSPEEDEDH